jgi:hypothetical protein
MSEAELHLLRGRLLAGMRHKAQKGELRVPLPVGYDYDAEDKIVLCRDEAEREAVTTIFRRFEELGSARQVLLSFLGDGLDLPRRRPKGRVEWARPTLASVYNVLTNPCYAGAFAFGRTRTVHEIGPDGVRVTRKRHKREPDKWSVLIRDHHPGYVSFETFEANLARLAANSAAPKGEGGGAPREGSALLQGLLRCGRCGRMMRVGYSGSKPPPGSASPGVSSRYVCSLSEPFARIGPTCQSFGGRGIERAVIDEVFAALQPAGLEATLKALAEADAARSTRLALFEAALERTRYEAERARRQFDACEPENRLVARSLEAEWERRLTAVGDAEAALTAERSRHQSELGAEEIAWLKEAGADLRAVFEAKSTTVRERKQLLRMLLVEVMVTVDREAHRAELQLCWEGGATTRTTVELPRLGAPWRKTDESTVELVRRLAEHYDDATIATILSRQHRRTGAGLAYTKARVNELRHRHHIRAGEAATVTPDGQSEEMVSVTVAAAELGVGIGTIYRWLADGFIAGTQLTPGAPWQIRLDDELRSKVTDEAPAGWLPLGAAAKALGVARQTVLHKVQRGELAAVHVHHGRRGSLCIQVEPVPVGLFD